MKYNDNEDVIQRRMNAQCVVIGGALFLLGTTAIIVANTAPSITSAITNVFASALRSSSEAIQR